MVASKVLGAETKARLWTTFLFGSIVGAATAPWDDVDVKESEDRLLFVSSTAELCLITSTSVLALWLLDVEEGLFPSNPSPAFSEISNIREMQVARSSLALLASAL